MNRSKKSRADTLRDLRASERARLNSRLVDGTSSIGELRDLSERVQLLDAAIKQEEPPRTAKRLAFIALAVATVIIAAASMRMPSVRFSLEAEAHSISLRAGAAQSLSGFPSGSELRVTDGCGVLSSSNIGLTSAVRGQQADPLTLRATSLAVQHLTFGASSLLTVTPGGNALQVSVENSTAPIAIELEMSGDANGFFGDST
ncbi:MAG TPA: hypothetical protein VKB34_07020, partial [Povalibacter sp.]|nr:hypothetical protein [Povalibacter sp.]